MAEQNFKNHAKSVRGFHGVLFLMLLSLLGGSINFIAKATPDQMYLASLFCLLSVALILMTWYIRIFPLKAQDRAIRAEERLRYYLLAKKPMPEALRISQIIALRFASDQEYLALAQRALEENLGQKEIKAAIQNWKADHYRV
jgi:hypothetical protein